MDSVTRSVDNELCGTELIREWSPQGDPKAVIVLVHGIAEHSGRYERTGSLLADAGYLVRSFDLIGGGASGGERWDTEDWSLYHDQIEGHMKWAKEQGKPVVLMGHSMGGNLAIEYSLEDRIEPDLLVVSAPALAGGAAWQKALAPFAARMAPKLVMPNGVKGEQLSRDPAVGEAYFDDPLVVPKSTTRLGQELFAAMDRINDSYDDLVVETLCLHGGSDPIVPPQSTAALGELPNVNRTVYPGLRHEILNEPEGPEIVADIVTWLDERV